METMETANGDFNDLFLSLLILITQKLEIFKKHMDQRILQWEGVLNDSSRFFFFI